MDVNNKNIPGDRQVAAQNEPVKKVVTGSVQKKKKSGVHKFTDVFLAEDMSKVKNFIFMDVIVPKLKQAAVDIVTDGINVLLYGDTAHKKKSNVSRVSYASYYEKGSESRKDYSAIRSRNVYDYDDILLESRVEGEHVLDCLGDIIDRFGQASVADLYQLVGENPVHTDYRYGWTSIASASVVPVRGGWMLKLPRVTDIKL